MKVGHGLNHQVEVFSAIYNELVVEPPNPKNMLVKLDFFPQVGLKIKTYLKHFETTT